MEEHNEQKLEEQRDVERAAHREEHNRRVAGESLPAQPVSAVPTPEPTPEPTTEPNTETEPVETPPHEPPAEAPTEPAHEPAPSEADAGATE